MKTQLIKLMDQLGLTATRFADEIGVQRSSISHILSERNRPSYDFILKIIKRYPEINAEWLLTGIGTMEKSEYKGHPEAEKVLFDHKAINRKDESQSEYNASDVNRAASSDNSEDIEVTNVNFIEKIIIFYHDKTFVEYKPK